MALKTEKYRKYYLKCSNTFLPTVLVLINLTNTLTRIACTETAYRKWIICFIIWLFSTTKAFIDFYYCTLMHIESVSFYMCCIEIVWKWHNTTEPNVRGKILMHIRTISNGKKDKFNKYREVFVILKISWYKCLN